MSRIIAIAVIAIVVVVVVAVVVSNSATPLPRCASSRCRRQ